MSQRPFWAKNTQEQKSNQVDALEVQCLQQAGAQLIDVRDPSEFAASHPKGAINIPLSELMQRIGEVPTATPVLLICSTGILSRSILTMLKQKNITNVRSVKGGMIAWTATQLPME